jgi:DegV family protein with EDD domain
MRIGIVTDSTADLPRELVEKYEIEVVPLQVSMDNHSYRDGVDLTSTEFYQKLQMTDSQPVTSQPSPGIFVDCYRGLLERVDAIISIHLTGKFSGTVRVAQMAREMLPQANIRVIDSGSTSMALGSMVLEAARAAQRGVKFDQVVTLVNQLCEQVCFLLTLDTLEFLRRGGRASRLQTFLSSILQIKPLLSVVRGEIELIAKVRSRRDAIQMMLEEFKTQVEVDSRAIISVVHTAAENEALRLKAIIQETFLNAEVIINQAGPVLGTHVGPGALALVSLAKV